MTSPSSANSIFNNNVNHGVSILHSNSSIISLAQFHIFILTRNAMYIHVSFFLLRMCSVNDFVTYRNMLQRTDGRYDPEIYIVVDHWCGSRS
jgi:hypothetical protein